MFRSSIPYAVIGVVSKQKDLSVQWLYEQVCNAGISVSLPNFYKIIAHMVDDQILIRPKGRVQLHALFMRYLFGLTEASTKAYFDQENSSIHHIAVGQQESWEENTLYDLNVIRMDLLWQLVKMHEWETSYHYCSHPYHLLATPLKEKTNLEELTTSEDKSYILIGNNTFLDRYAAQQLADDKFLIKCADKETPFPTEGYCVDIIGDYIVECMLPQNMSEHFVPFFQTIVWIEWYKPELLCQVLKMKSPCTIKLIHSPEHAQKMKMKIKKQIVS